MLILCIYAEYCLCVRCYFGQCEFWECIMKLKHAHHKYMINALATDRLPSVGYTQLSIH